MSASPRRPADLLVDPLGTAHVLGDRVFRIGRAEDNDLTLPDSASASRYHAAVEPSGGTRTVVDLDSSNGTFVNGRRTRRRRLFDGDRIRIGEVELRFRAAEPEREREAREREAVRVCGSAVERVVSEHAPTDLAALRTLREQAERAVEDAARAHRQSALLDTLYEVGRALVGADDERDLLRRVVDLAVEVSDADNGAVLTLDEAGDARVRIARGAARDDLVGLRISREIVDRVVARDGPWLTEDALADRELSRRLSVVEHRVRSVACVPVPTREAARALLYLDHRGRSDVFGDAELELLQSFARQVALALDNAHLARVARRSERHAAIGSMATKVVHDLKSPLQTASGFARRLEERTHDPDLRRRARTVRGQIERIDGRVRDILSYVRGEAPAVRRLDRHPASVVRELGDALRDDLADEGVVMETLDRHPGTVALDPDLLLRALENLASNSLEAFDGDGGRIQVRIEAEEGGGCALEWHDDGPGIPAEVLPRVCEPFVTHDKVSGTGLGLTIVARIAEAHGGRVEVRSPPGRGTCVRVTLAGDGG